MGWGVLQDPHMAAPPGTATIGATQDVEDFTAETKGLKRDGNIILQPQPSDNPNDPLNWSRAWKESIILVLAFSSGVTTSLGPMVTPGIRVVAMRYRVNLDQVSSLMIGFLAFWIGFTTFFTASGANIWGKRPFFVISTVILLGTNIWGFFATSFPSLAIMRVIQGIASAPLETLVTSTVSDLFFVHQRGTRLSLWGCMLASGVLLGQTISGFIIQNLSFEATFGISALIFIPILLLMYCVVVETTYTAPRQQRFDKEEKESFWFVEADKKETYSQQLRLFRGRLSPESFWMGCFKPLPLIAYPSVLFSTIVYGSYFTWLITISLLAVNIFSAPPYNLNPAQIGLTNLPLLAVGLIGSPLSGWMADAVVKFMARKNRGVFEPEFRLTLMVIATPLATAGFLGFGMSVQKGAPLQWPMLFMSLHALSVPFASQASLTYVIDCHPKDANQAFVTINFTKAVFMFLATTYANGWIERVGPRGVFDAITLINLGVCFLTVPSYVFGKKFRGMIARSKFGQAISR
ncbi:MFS general substrate transporter [Delitschia confertaspora ATCC 74209]|uniref:MFS general substrate transporter n=1 Tax=Delitschia confertaspora ATCC 74209 TaxID=1513339 RepID=A0A9P4JDE8_9PLEO|nr:MFS general substrate transporter [Delitschia confertaspora ATCC 74209]